MTSGSKIFHQSYVGNCVCAAFICSLAEPDFLRGKIGRWYQRPKNWDPPKPWRPALGARGRRFRSCPPGQTSWGLGRSHQAMEGRKARSPEGSIAGGEISLPYLAQASKPKISELNNAPRHSKTSLKARQHDFDLWYILPVPLVLPNAS